MLRSGFRFSFEAVPWALCLAVALTALRARVFFTEVFMRAWYPIPAGLHGFLVLSRAMVPGTEEVLQALKQKPDPVNGSEMLD